MFYIVYKFNEMENLSEKKMYIIKIFNNLNGFDLRAIHFCKINKEFLKNNF